jgi:hypothetical protein
MPAPRQTGSDVPHGATTLVDVLRHWAELQPHERVFTFLVDGETHEATPTFCELDRQARAKCSGQCLRDGSIRQRIRES